MSTPVVIDLVSNDHDPGGGLVVTGVTQGTNGQVVLAGTRATYTPKPGFRGSDKFQYTITSATGNGSSSTARVYILVKSVTPTCTVTLTRSDGLVLGTPVQLVADARCNVGTPEVQFWHRAPGRAAKVFQPYSAQLTATFDTGRSLPGDHEFFAQVRSRGTATAVTSNRLTVELVDDVVPCTAVTLARPGIAGVITRGVPFAFSASAACPADVTAEFQLWARKKGTSEWGLLRGHGPATGTATLSRSGEWELSATARSIGSRVDVQLRSEAVRVSVSSGPVANDDQLNADEDDTAHINVLQNDHDPNHGILIVTITTPPGSGTATVQDATISYRGNRNYNGTDSLGYTITDRAGRTATATLHITIRPVNDRPKAIDDALTVTAGSSGSIDVLANDSDVDGDTLRAELDPYDGPYHGRVTRVGSVVTYTPDPGFIGNDSFEYKAIDPSGSRDTGRVFVTVVPPTTGPVAADDVIETAEDTTGTVDVLDNDTAANGDSLTVIAFNQPAHGSVTFSGGTASYTPAPNYNGPDVFSYTIRSGAGGTASAAVNVIVSAVNDPPIAIADSALLEEDTSVTVDVLANDSDADGDVLVISAVGSPAHGIAELVDGGVRYTPGASFFGSDSFSYTVADPSGAAATATVTLTVAGINDPPIAVADTASVAEDTSATIDVVANDSDVDGDPLTIDRITQPGHGTATIVDASHVRYTPAANYSGPDTFSYTIRDDRGGFASAVVTLDVGGINDAPEAVDNLAVVDEDGEVTVDVVANDVDPDGDALSIVAVTQPGHGIAQILDSRRVTYAPAANFNGSDSFTYTIDDGSGGQATATVTIAVLAVNDAPIAVADTASVAEDGVVTIAVLANDSDVEDDPLEIIEVTQPANGSAARDGAAIVYTPAPGFHGIDSFSYSIIDPSGAIATAAVTVEVGDVNDPPVAIADLASVDEDGAVTVDVVANDSDADADPLAIVSITQPEHGVALVVDARRIAYAPAANFHGSDALTYTISDGRGGQATGELVITVNSVNDAPVAVADAASLLEDTGVTIDLVANDSDVDGDSLAIVGIIQPASGAVVVLDGGHRVTYVPAANFHGSDSFTYTIADPFGASATAAVAITVISVNDAPIALVDSAQTDEDTAITVDVVANDFDVDGDALAIAAIVQPGHGIALVGDGRRITYVPAPDFHGSDVVGYTVSDGNGGLATAELAIQVIGVNDAPVAVADAATLAEDTSATIDVVANDSDADGDTLTVTAVTAPASGTVVIVDARRIRYTPAGNFHGADSVSYTVSDGNGAQASATVSFTVTPVNDPPVAVDDTATLAEDTSVTVDVVANDSDADGDNLAVISVATPPSGTTAIVDAHRISYTPHANFHGTDTIDYTVSDGAGGQATAKLTVTVTPVNDAPVATGVAVATFDDTPVTLTLAASDADGDPVTFAIATSPASGTLGGITGNQVVYTPAAGFVGSDSFTFTASDGQLTSPPAIAAITVAQSVCGNGVREGAHEECDDGDQGGGDGCEPSCRLTCGSGTGAARSTVDPASGHCFAAYDGVQRSYQDAAALCASVGGHLATITSADEDDAAFAAVAPGDQPWLGGDDIAVEGGFGWTTGEALGYTNFAASEPDDQGGADCLHYTGDGSWADAPCNSPSARGTLCELDLAVATPTFATGAGPRGVTVGDLDNDGLVDVATANQAANSVSILRGNGAGGFVAQPALPVSGGPIAIARGDFDRDGFVDLAVVTAGAVAIQRGTASGGFTPGQTLAIAGATSIAATDFDGDQLLDLAVGVNGGVQIQRGNGSGQFALHTTIGLLGLPAALAIGDFNHDGGPDLAITTPLAVVVVLSSGGGLFGLPISLTLTLNNRSITSADIDRDGNTDLVVANGNANVTVLFGTASGAFSGSTTVALAAQPQLVATGDFDGDGHPDVAALTGNYATLFRASGRALAQAGPPIATGGGAASFAAIGRINADGADDLVVVNQATASAGILIGGATGLIGSRALVAGTATASSASADFNGDSRGDLAIADPAGNRVLVFVQNAGGALVLASTITTAAGANASVLATGQFTADSNVDIAIVNAGLNSVGIASGNGNGTFTVPINSNTAAGPRGVAVGNADSDADIDIAVATATDNTLSVLLNNGTGRFGRVDVPISGAPQAVAVADLNRDGNLDFAVATANEPSVKIVFGRGDTTFPAPIALPIASGSQAIAAGDFDGDSFVDLVAGNTSAGSVSVLRNLGGGQFAPAATVAVGQQPNAVTVAEFDGDGRLDIVVGAQGSAELVVLHGNPAGGFVPTRIALGASPLQITVVDLDGDGHKDLAAATGSSFLTTLLSPR